MKKIILLIALFYGLQIASQRNRLTEKQWFITGVNIAGNGTACPMDKYNFPFAKLSFFSGGNGVAFAENFITKDACNYGFYSHVNYTNVQERSGNFTFIDFTPFSIDSGCLAEDNAMQDFMTTFNSFFENNSSENFSYFIQDVYGLDHLKIELPNGDFIWAQEYLFEWVPDNLTDYNWILQKTIIDGVETFTPDLSTENFSEIVLDIHNYFIENSQNHSLDVDQTFRIAGCNSLASIIDFDNQNNQFYLYGISGTLDDCGNGNTINYYNNFTNLFYNNLPGPFTYQLTQENNNTELVITNSLGNQAFFQRNTLSVQNEIQASFSVYPNPVKNILQIKTTNKIKEVRLYNLLGKIVIKTTENTINTSKLAKGIYVINVSFENGKSFTKKIVKE